jgi:hypothetical protein
MPISFTAETREERKELTGITGYTGIRNWNHEATRNNTKQN